VSTFRNRLLVEIRAWGEAALGDVALVLTRLDGQG
jgi:hypothetical protein